MKIIALLPFKNESKFLHSCISSLKPVCDGIIAYDDLSEDDGKNIIESYEDSSFFVKIINGEKTSDWGVDKIRNMLFQKGREACGTHFVCLDADEAFTSNFSKHGKKIIARLEEGQRLRMQWLALWKELYHYRDDQSPWSNNFKDFIYCDDGKSLIEERYLCESRTPGTEKNELILNEKYGAVMHFQFADWQRFQLKQAWYRCKELLKGKPVHAINEKYSITLDTFGSKIILNKMPDSWFENFKMPLIESQAITEENCWHLREINKMFAEHGKEKFSKLDIWHIAV